MFTKRTVIIALALVFLTIGRIINQKGIENIRGLYILNLITCGFAIGVFFMSLVVFLKIKKNK